ncbi:MAG: septal ring lytic transglycosylase RlpA family protein [Chitinophagaceae bacterium]|nr:septal ring lytic transglycosylase RlpA family protein [Chitinophagaceae bacterium]
MKKYYYMIKLFLFLFSFYLATGAHAQVDTTGMIRDTTIKIIGLDTSVQKDSLGAADSLVFIKTQKPIKGIASFYSANLDGTRTATGEVFRNKKLTGASNHLKLNTWVRVTNLSNDKTVIVRINDRMHPAMKRKGRVIDLSRAAAKELDFIKKGLTRVKLEVIEKPKLL